MVADIYYKNTNEQLHRLNYLNCKSFDSPSLKTTHMTGEEGSRCPDFKTIVVGNVG